jgi:hypothetical protein
MEGNVKHPTWKIVQSDSGWHIMKLANGSGPVAAYVGLGWGPLADVQDAVKALNDYLGRVAADKRKEAQYEANAKYFDENGTPAAFAGAGAMGVTYGK